MRNLKQGSGIFGIIAFFVIIVAIPLTIYLAKTQQEIRQRAEVAVTPAPSCQAVPTDTMLIIDTSGSMGYDYVNGRPVRPNDKLIKAKQAAKLFVNNLAKDNRSRVGLVSFSNDLLLGSPITQDFQTVKTRIQALIANGGTCTRCGIKGGNEQITANGQAGIKKVAILLTDGLANMIYRTDPISTFTPNPTVTQTVTPSPALTITITPSVTQSPSSTPTLTITPTIKCTKIGQYIYCPPTPPFRVLGESDSAMGEFSDQNDIAAFGDTRQVEPRIAEKIALDVAKQGNRASRTVFYTIGLGSDVNASFLTEIARSTGGEYFFAASSGELQGIYDQIFQIIGRGSVSGFVWHDVNGNAIHDSSEQKLPDWKINLYKTVYNPPIFKTTLTNASGEYSINDLCDGGYILGQEVKNGFNQTFPAGAGQWAITIIDGKHHPYANFGNKAGVSPTPTATPTATLTPTPTCTVPPPGCGNIGTPNPSLPACGIPMPTGGWCQISPTPDAGATRLELDLKLQSIGSESGTSVNNDPKTPTRQVTIEIFNSANTSTQALVGTLSGNVRFDNTSGTFKGAIPVPGNIRAGVYSIKVATGKYLKKLAGRDSRQPLQQIVIGRPVKVSQTMLIVGDINGDNNLNIDDWHIWRACFNKNVNTPVPLDGIEGNCGIADLNDDSEVDHQPDSKKGVILNMRDYQWLFNSFQVQMGD